MMTEEKCNELPYVSNSNMERSINKLRYNISNLN